MSHFQTKKLSLHVIIVFLLVVLQGFHTQVQAESTEKRDTAQSLWMQGTHAFNERDYQTALEKFNNSLTIYRELGDQQSEADILTWLSATKLYIDQYDVDVLDYLKESQKIYKKLNSKPGEMAVVKDVDKAMRALVLFVEGTNYKNANDYKSALKKYHDALQLVREMGERRYEAGILYLAGSMYSFMTYYTEALKVYNKALVIFKEFDDLTKQGDVLLDIGEIYNRQGNYLEAVDNLQKALKIFKLIKDNNGQVYAMDALSNVYKLLGDHEKAKEYNLKKLNIGDADKKTKSSEYYSLLDNGEKEYKFDKALNFYYQALELSKNDKNKREEILVLNRIGDIYLRLGNYTKALDIYKQALNLSEEQKDNIQKLTALLSIAQAYLLQLNVENVLDYSRQALIVAKGIWARGAEKTCYGLMGLSYSLLKDFSKAKAYYLKALLLSKELGLPEDIRTYQLKIGEIAEYSGQLKEAKYYISEAIKTIESIRERIAIDEYKRSYMEDKLSVYHYMISLLLRLEEYEEAFNYLERSKSRSLLDMLGNRLSLKKGKDKELSHEEMRLQKKINELLEKIQKEYSQPKEKKRAVLDVWNKELEKTRKEYSEQLLKIKINSPELYSLVSVQPLTLKKVQEVIAPDTTLLEYCILTFPEEGIDFVIYFVVNKKEYWVLVQKVSELASTITTFREKIATFQPDYEKEAEELYDLLIRPAKPYIKTKRICIIPHSVLHYLPFQALINGDGGTDQTENQSRFLIEEYDIFYSPSASVLKFVLEKRKEHSGNILAFGNPELGDESLNLPYAEEELKKIKGNYPDTSLFLNEDATEEKAKLLTGDYNIVHFASHGELNPESPLFSCIRLAKDTDEDGRLEVHEIFNLDLNNTSLVTLSACETGLGKLTSGDELIGLTRGFIYAGTPSIVASLWKVNDQSTSELMNLFYKNLKTHSKVEALRMAQLEMINGELGRGIVRGIGGITTSEEDHDKPQSTLTVNGSHPYFWAPFILLGDWK